MSKPTTEEIKARLEYLRGEIKAERISYGEIAELQDLAPYIDKDDVLLLEWAGVPEHEEMVHCKFCDEETPAGTAHLHEGGWVGDNCCWDERLRATE